MAIHTTKKRSKAGHFIDALTGENTDADPRRKGDRHLVSLDPNFPLPKGRPSKKMTKLIIARNREIMGMSVRKPNLPELIHPDKVSITDALRILLGVVDEKTNCTMGYQIARRLIDVANAGDIEAIKEILNRIDGKVAEKHEMTGSLPIQIIFRPVEVKADSISIEGEAKELPLPTEELNAQVA
jgi:hypothetical protein